MGQEDLSAFGGGAEEPHPDSETPRGNSRRIGALKSAPPNAEPYEDDSCPWCLAPAEDFREAHSSQIDDPVCSNCNARIPVHMDWYQRGEKICFDRHDV